MTFSGYIAREDTAAGDSNERSREIHAVLAHMQFNKIPKHRGRAQRNRADFCHRGRSSIMMTPDAARCRGNRCPQAHYINTVTNDRAN